MNQLVFKPNCIEQLDGLFGSKCDFIKSNAIESKEMNGVLCGYREYNAASDNTELVIVGVTEDDAGWSSVSKTDVIIKKSSDRKYNYSKLDTVTVYADAEKLAEQYNIHNEIISNHIRMIGTKCFYPSLILPEYTGVVCGLHIQQGSISFIIGYDKCSPYEYADNARGESYFLCSKHAYYDVRDREEIVFTSDHTECPSKHTLPEEIVADNEVSEHGPEEHIGVEETPDGGMCFTGKLPEGTLYVDNGNIKNGWCVDGYAAKVVSIGEEKPCNAFDAQVDGSHYKDMVIQPIEFCRLNNIPFAEANAIKYICRHRSKNKAQDIRKAIHMLELILEDYENTGETLINRLNERLSTLNL